MINMWRQLALPPEGARQTNPLIGVIPKPGPLGQDIYTYSHPIAPPWVVQLNFIRFTRNFRIKS